MDQKILNKLQKLLALQDSAKAIGSAAEAETVAAKINELLLLHNLSLSELRDSQKPEERESMGKADIEVDKLTNKKEGDWVYQLYCVIARHNLCEAIKRTYNLSNGNFYFVSLLGYKDNVEIVKYTVDNIVPQIKRLASAAYSEYVRDERGDSKRNAYLRGYYRGIVGGLNASLRRSVQELEASNTSINALIRVNTEELEKTVAKAFPSLKSVKRKPLSSTDGYSRGVLDSGNVQLQKGLDNSKNKQIQ